MSRAEYSAGSRDGLVAVGPTLDILIASPDENKIIGPVPALVDTGASASCIDRRLCAQAGLPAVDQLQLAGVFGPEATTAHVGKIRVPSLGLEAFGKFAAVDLQGGGQPHFALLGRDFLSLCKMMYDGQSGRVEISIAERDS